MKTYELKETKHPDLFRVVDRDGNWERYYLKSKDLYLDGVTTLLAQGYAKGPFFEEWLANHTSAERDAILKAAGERGDKVHRVIDTILSEKPASVRRDVLVHNRETKKDERLENDEWDALLSWGSFWNAHGPAVIASETTLYNEAHRYAGTADALLILTKSCGIRTCKCAELVGKIGLWDWKTSSGIRASYSAQVGAYANTDNLREHLPNGKTAVDYVAILRLGTNHKTTGGYELKAFIGSEALADCYARFRAAKKIADFERKPFDPAVDIVDIPDTIELTVRSVGAKVEAPAASDVKEVKKVEKKPSTKHENNRKGSESVRGKRREVRHAAA